MSKLFCFSRIKYPRLKFAIIMYTSFSLFKFVLTISVYLSYKNKIVRRYFIKYTVVCIYHKFTYNSVLRSYLWAKFILRKDKQRSTKVDLQTFLDSYLKINESPYLVFLKTLDSNVNYSDLPPFLYYNRQIGFTLNLLLL